MSIDYTLTLQGNELTSDTILNHLKKLGLICNEPIKLKKAIEINQFRYDYGITIYLTDSNPEPNDALDFEHLDKEFKYGKSLTFEFAKNFENSDTRWKFIFTMIFSIMNQLKTNAVFSFGVDTLYCFFSKNHELFINTKSGVWNNQYFKENAVGWKCFDIEKSVVVF